MIKKENITVSRSRRFCDVCNTEIKKDLACSVIRCDICKKDLCENHVGMELPMQGDYRYGYCKKCSDIGAPYMEAIKRLEKHIDVLYSAWEKQALKEK